MKKALLLIAFGLALILCIPLAGCKTESTTIPSTPNQPAGIGGWQEPRPLTDDEKAAVVRIAVSSPEASAWLQNETDYRVGPVGWYAITEAGSWWAPEYSIVDEGIPEYIPSDVLWYPGVTIAVGEGTILQMQIAVDLDAGKTAMTTGPYPSLGSPDRFKSLPPIPSPSPSPGPAGSWPVGEDLYYSQQPIWGNSLVGLELEFKDGETARSQIIVYDLEKREPKRTIELPEGLLADTPAIYENKVVFASVDKDAVFQEAASSGFGPLPDYDIFLYDLETGQLQQLTDDEHAQMHPRIHGDTVVWLDARNQSTDQYPPPFDIYALDLKTGEETRITANTTAEGYSPLAVSGNRVVWTDMRHADAGITSHPENDPGYNNEIYVYDLSTDQENRITTSLANDRNPAIDGSRVVWLRQEDYRKADVFLYDLESGQETQISRSGYADFIPSISGDRIAWTDARSSQGNTSNDVVINGQEPGANIYLFDLKTGTETRLTETESGQVWCASVIHDAHIVYQLSRQIGGIVYALGL